MPLTTFDARRPRLDHLPVLGRNLAPSGRLCSRGTWRGTWPLTGWLTTVFVGLVVAGCGALPPPASLQVSPSAGGSPVASLPAGSVSPGGSVSSPCPIEPMEGRLPSNRLLAVVVDPAGTWVRFRFGPATGPPGEGSLEAAQPPFDRTASGLPVEVLGERVVRLHFEALLLFDELGYPTYGGPDRLRPLAGPIRDVVVEEAFEGVMNWLVGFDGPACLRLRQGLDPLDLELVVTPTE